MSDYTREARSLVVENRGLREALAAVMRQTEADLAAAHEVICKLQDLDPSAHSWPDWSSPANTLRWFKEIREKFDIQED